MKYLKIEKCDDCPYSKLNENDKLINELLDLYLDELKQLKICNRPKRKATGKFVVMSNGKHNNSKLGVSYHLCNPDGYVLRTTTEFKKITIFSILLNHMYNNDFVLINTLKN